MLKLGFSILLTLVLLSSCKKVDKFTQFEKEYNSEATIPSLIGVNLPFDLPTPEITTNIEKDLEVNDTRKDLIEKAILKQLKVSIVTNTNQNFNFVNDIDIFINSNSFPKKKIAFLHAIPENNSKVLLFDLIKDLDIKDYIKEDKFKLELKIVTDKTILQEVDLSIDTRIFIDAKVLGI